MPPDDIDAQVQVLRGFDILLLIPPASSDKVVLSKRLVDAAICADVRTIVLISALGLESSRDKHSLQQFLDIEAYLTSRARTRQIAIVRAGFYIQKLIPHFLAGKWAPVNLRDVSRFVCALIRTGQLLPDQRGQTYSLTGPESLSCEQMCRMMSDVLGVHLQYKDITPEAAMQILSTIAWLDDSEKSLIIDMYDLIAHGAYDLVTDDFQLITQSRPLSVSAFIQENKAELNVAH
ncbi:hypothetical protein RI367_004388 [Sorochytrium milnesiophthora]